MHFKTGEYIDYPRGRVVWDKEKNHSIIYIDPCINRKDVLSQIISSFNIGEYVIEYDDHYHCKNCVGDLFNWIMSMNGAVIKVTALFCYALNMEHIFEYTELKDNDDVCGGS